MIRGVGLRSAVAVNVATMIGAGPLITIPLVVVALHGSVSIAAWIVGALVALCDGLVFAELAARLPRSGGTYAYVREGFGARGAGRLVAFLFVWQYCFWAPLILASGYIGFAQYAGFLVPALATNPIAQKIVAVGVGIVVMVALARAIPTIARTVLVLGAISLGTILVVAAAGLAHPHVPLGHLVTHAFDGVGLSAFGAALVITIYDYGGYNDVCALGEEIQHPTRTIPLAIVISVALVAVAYIALNLGVFATLPIERVAASSAVASDVIERTLGHSAAIGVTIAILITAFASTYGLLLAAARVPFAAARDGEFLAPFARLHPSGKYPAFSLFVLGTLALPAALLPLDAVIAALTAGIVLVQGVAQILALALLRARSPAAPFRVPLYPLPPLVALVGWVYLFWSSGSAAMIFGTSTLALGAIVFLARAFRMRTWPFAALAAMLLACVVAHPTTARAATYTQSIVERANGNPTLVVDGKPFFFYGAAFFYERIPAMQWRASMAALKAMGFNTLDLYVPWNWHEVSDGVFDFDGHTDPRRNLREVVRLAASFDFKLVVRPGPVIRNEWRNGGYPAWLLERPEYDMPLHDVLEGRYPATATLQNANSDDAAAQWMRNATHMTYAARWLKRALHEFDPVADRVLAVQLDDDQGAYIDNQTWPAPHLTAYLDALEKTVRTVVGPTLPVFINTYEMKVTASAPVWAMGNWYQSDAYSIGEHDRAALEFSTGLLQTQPQWPVAISEFQAGWLAQPEDPEPRPADPTNTTLALHTMLGMGARGVIDFPAQDTVNPAGWEAPFANASYAWDAALTVDLEHSARYAPTRAFGAIVQRYGGELASARRVSDGAIAYLTSAYDSARITNADIFRIAARTQDAQRACRAANLTCDLVDLSYVRAAALARYPFVIVPQPSVPLPFTSGVQTRLDSYQRAGGHVVSAPPLVDHPANGGIPDATLLHAVDGTAFLEIVNYDDRPRTIPTTTLHVGTVTYDIAERTLAPRAAALVRLDRRNAPSARIDGNRRGPSDVRQLAAEPEIRRDCSAGSLDVPTVSATESVGGDPLVRLANGIVRVLISPHAGARIIGFGRMDVSGCARASVVTSVGALRDDVEIQPPLSTTDRIGKYTRSFPAGMFNRTYVATTLPDGGAAWAAVAFRYDAPDVEPAGAHFDRVVRIARAAPRFTVEDRTRFDGAARSQRVVRYDSFDTRTAEVIDEHTSDAIGIYDRTAQLVTVVTWPHDDVEEARLIQERTSVVLRLRFAPAAPDHPRRTSYAILPADSRAAARAAIEQERAVVGAKR